MKAAVLIGQRNIRIQEVIEEVLEPNEVRVKVEACGICGSDLPRYFDGAVHGFPIVLGHEFAGKIVECGSNVENWKIGDRVAGAPLRPCEICNECLSHNYSLCKNYRFTGSKINGAFAEMVVLPQKNLVRVSDSIDLADAIFFETSSVAFHAIDLLGDINNHTVAVIGSGTVGWLCAQWARIEGAKQVVMIGRNDDEQEKIAEFGVNAYLSSSASTFAQDVLDMTSNAGFTKVIDAVGVSDTIKMAFDIAANHATISIVGTPTDNISFSAREWTLLNRKELTVKGSWMGYSGPFPGREWTRTAEAVENGSLKLGGSLVFKTYSLDDITKAFEVHESDEKVRGRIVVQMKND